MKLLIAKFIAAVGMTTRPADALDMPEPLETSECGAGYEPPEHEYFEIEEAVEGQELPEVKHFSGDSLTKDVFDKLMAKGMPFVVEQSSEIKSWDLAKWDCDFFSSDPDFRQASMVNH
jgi:hypothetical protein